MLPSRGGWYGGYVAVGRTVCGCVPPTFTIWLIAAAPRPGPIGPRLVSYWYWLARLDPSPPEDDPGFIAIAISRRCSAWSSVAGLWMLMIESILKPGCGLSQLRGVEYKPSRCGTSEGATESILERCSARLILEKFSSSSSERALSSALSSTPSSVAPGFDCKTCLDPADGLRFRCLGIIALSAPARDLGHSLGAAEGWVQAQVGLDWYHVNPPVRVGSSRFRRSALSFSLGRRISRRFLPSPFLIVVELEPIVNRVERCCVSAEL